MGLTEAEVKVKTQSLRTEHILRDIKSGELDPIIEEVINFRSGTGSDSDYVGSRNDFLTQFNVTFRKMLGPENFFSVLAALKEKGE